MNFDDLSPAYRAQVDLLLQVIPLVAKETCFALKGGTAINMFVWEMPRLSVDIDLTYLLFDDRPVALASISAALARIRTGIESTILDCRVTPVAQPDRPEAKLICRTARAQVKVEVNTTIRGHLYPTVERDVAEAVEDAFGRFVSIRLVSDGELFGGKICAALDRQHPRDLFDMQQFFNERDFSEEIRYGFIALLLSSPRPIHEMLRPNFVDQRHVFGTQFSGMTRIPFTYDDFELTRDRLVREIHQALTEEDRRFLISFKKGEPDWSLFPLSRINELPSVKWKLSNIQNLKASDPTKHRELLSSLERALEN